MLLSVFRAVPEIYNFVHQSYSSASVLQFGSFTVSSQTGAQQGDPLGPLLFCLALQPVLLSLRSAFRLGFLDDISLGGPPTVVASDVRVLASLTSSLGLELNFAKCEFYSPLALPPVDPVFSEFKRLTLGSLTLLGAALFKGSALDESLQAHCIFLEKAIEVLCGLPIQSGVFLLRFCGAPRVNYALRCSPCLNHPKLYQLDRLLKRGLERLLSADLSAAQWLQASLPIRDGGLGLRRISSLASSAYLASAASTQELQTAILLNCVSGQDPYLNEALRARQGSFPSTPSSDQRAWDRPVLNQDILTVWSIMNTPMDWARLTAICDPRSCDWLITAHPNRSRGFDARLVLGVRLGLVTTAASFSGKTRDTTSVSTHSSSSMTVSKTDVSGRSYK